MGRWVLDVLWSDAVKYRHGKSEPLPPDSRPTISGGCFTCCCPATHAESILILAPDSFLMTVMLDPPGPMMRPTLSLV
eukprot:scaffold124436_cov35-Tisochrysis_lutea.AAC.5